jgi:hypothetical protein
LQFILHLLFYFALYHRSAIIIARYYFTPLPKARRNPTAKVQSGQFDPEQAKHFMRANDSFLHITATCG